MNCNSAHIRPTTPAPGRRKHHVNLDQITAIRIAIRDTTGAIARRETPEPTRTALQAHLDVLLKEELRALTGQAPEGNLTVNSDDDWVDLPGPPIHVSKVVIARTADGTVLGPIPIGYPDTESLVALSRIVAYKVVKP